MNMGVAGDAKVPISARDQPIPPVRVETTRQPLSNGDMQLLN
ncbi:hypothetical protein [Variovorax sp.]